MTNISELRNANESDYSQILTLNDAVVEQTSPMDIDRLQTLASLADYLKVILHNDIRVGFLMAMRNGVPYSNDNYDWFASRYMNFLYVDRIVIDAQQAGNGLGRRLYQDLFQYAADSSVDAIVCEINNVPPNPSSVAFHQKLGFTEVGTQWVADGKKQVSMQMRKV